MSEKRANVSYHFKFDPSKMSVGAIKFPREITRTISAGEEIKVEKISIDQLPHEVVGDLESVMEKAILEANRKSAPKPSATKSTAPAEKKEANLEPEKEEPHASKPTSDGLSLFG